jgi:CubicO group peptidase (beta-lactamase class C family)
MKRIFKFLFLYFILFSTACFSQQNNKTPQRFSIASDPASVGFEASRLQRIDSMLAVNVREKRMPCGISLVARYGKIVHFKAYGYKDVENNVAVSKTDIFRLASQTKAITAVLLMTLFEEGKFLLDDPIDKYLPVFANPQVYVSGSAANGDLKTRPASRKITIRHLLSHSSGFGYDPYGEDLRIVNYAYPVTTKEIVERIARTPLRHDPGENFSYGFSSEIAGYLAEVLTGKKLDVLMKERIFDPLGMNDTYFFLPKEKHNRLAKAYIRYPQDETYSLFKDEIEQIYPLAENQPYNGGGAGLNGTIEDYAKFCQMLLNKGEFNNHRILSSKTVELMAANALPPAAGNFQFGLSLQIYDLNTYVKIMAPVGTLGWSGAYNTKYLIDGENDMIVLFFTSIWDLAQGIQDKFIISVYQAMK